MVLRLMRGGWSCGIVACFSPRFDGSNHLAEVIQGVTFKDGIKQIQNAA